LQCNISGLVRMIVPKLRFQQLTITKLMLRHHGYIYEKKHEGWYSVSDETFYPASAVHFALDPSTGRKFMVRFRVRGFLENSSNLFRRR